MSISKRTNLGASKRDECLRPLDTKLKDLDSTPGSSMMVNGENHRSFANLHVFAMTHTYTNTNVKKKMMLTLFYLINF